MKKQIITLTVTLTLTLSLLTGCGLSEAYTSQSATDTTASFTTGAVVSTDSIYDSGIAQGSSYSYETVTEEAEDSYDTDYSDSTTSSTQDPDSLTLLEEKLVYYCDLSIETLDYDATMASIKDTIKKYNGIIQSENESDSSYNWYYENYTKTSGTMNNYIEVRIPSADYENFVSELDGVGKITSKSTSVDNISQKYYDTTTKIDALEIQEQNLLEMLEKCETIEDMITVEERLSEVWYELNNLKTSKRYMDTDVAYSYVNINVSEVMEYHYTDEPTKKNTFTDRLKNTLSSTKKGFLSFLEELLFLIIRIFPYLIIAAVICLIFRKKIKSAITDHRTKKETQRAERALKYNAVKQQMQQQNIADNFIAKSCNAKSCNAKSCDANNCDADNGNANNKNAQDKNEV